MAQHPLQLVVYQVQQMLQRIQVQQRSLLVALALHLVLQHNNNNNNNNKNPNLQQTNNNNNFNLETTAQKQSQHNAPVGTRLTTQRGKSVRNPLRPEEITFHTLMEARISKAAGHNGNIFSPSNPNAMGNDIARTQPHWMSPSKFMPTGVDPFTTLHRRRASEDELYAGDDAEHGMHGGDDDDGNGDYGTGCGGKNVIYNS
eukprot:UN00140